jgi:hypothetical protein
MITVLKTATKDYIMHLIQHDYDKNTLSEILYYLVYLADRLHDADKSFNRSSFLQECFYDILATQPKRLIDINPLTRGTIFDLCTAHGKTTSITILEANNGRIIFEDGSDKEQFNREIVALSEYWEAVGFHCENVRLTSRIPNRCVVFRAGSGKD